MLKEHFRALVWSSYILFKQCVISHCYYSVLGMGFFSYSPYFQQLPHSVYYQALDI